jgi:hypothetical protein
MVHPAEEMLVVKLVKTPIRLLLYAILHQPDASGIHGSINHLHLPHYPDWHSTSDRQAKYGLCQLDNATEQRCTACQYDAGRHLLGVCTPHDFTTCHFQHFLHPWLDDVADLLAGELARMALSSTADFYSCLRVKQGTIGTAMGYLETLGFWGQKI